MRRLLCAWLVLALSLPLAAAAPLPAPADYLGFRPGDDQRLAGWEQLLGYCRAVAEASPRVRLVELGETTQGRPMVALEIASPATLESVEWHREAQALLSDPRRVGTPEEARRLTDESKPVVLINCGLHATEVAAAQMSMILLHELAAGETPQARELLDRVIVVLIPCANPDGLDMIKDWYERSLGKPWEGTGLPWLYQEYAGHDNNRDWYMLNLKETRNLTRLIYDLWRPTIVYDVHQMGNAGARFFVPPFHDPKNPNVPPLIEQTLLIIGGHMAQALSRAGKTGVIRDALYDNWWAGGFRTTVYRHNMIGILTEAAGANLASPVFQRKGDLKGHTRGLPEYAMTSNHPEPWPGGWWRLKDPVEYQFISAMALLEYAARYHGQLQEQYLWLGRQAIEQGRTEPPFAWLVPPDQRDPAAAYSMLARLMATGIEVHVADEPFTADGVPWPAGTFILFCAQPYRPHLMDMMERQQYPDRELFPGGPAEPPYDMAGWTLPLQMGVRHAAVAAPFEAKSTLLETIEMPQGRLEGRAAAGGHYLLAAGANDDFRLLNRLARAGIEASIVTGSTGDGRGAPAPGSIFIPDGDALRAAAPGILRDLSVSPVSVPRLVHAPAGYAPPPPRGRFRPGAGRKGGGWTRFVLDQHEYAYTSLTNAEIRAGNLRARYDCIILPAASASSIMNGQAPDTTAPEFVGGIGEEGVVALQRFASEGGSLVCIDDACALAIEHLGLPVKNVLDGKKSEEFFCPGSLLRVRLDPSSPLAWGLPEWVSGYFARSQAFEIAKPAKVPDERDPAGRYPASAAARYADTLLLESGWIRGGELIEDKPAVVEVSYGEGRVILLGFSVVQRAQPHGTFRLLFNAIQRSTLDLDSQPKGG